jgi:hypothetical protein
MSTSTALHAATPPPPPTTRARTAAVLAGALAAVAVLLELLLVVSGVDVLQAARVTLVVVVQLATGTLLWRWVRGSVASGFAETVGMGLGLGTLTSLLGAQLLLPVGLGGLGWLLPTALVAAAALLPSVRRRLRAGEVRPPALDEVGGLLAGIAVALVPVRSFWQVHPLEWNGWWRYYSDIPHHEALSSSLATWGPGDSILAVGEPTRYHWFAHGWAGAVADAAAAEPFVAVTRVLPLVTVLGTVCLVWAWARRLTDSRAAPWLALLVTVLATDVATERQLGFVDLFTISPSLGLPALWFLAAALVLTEHLHGRLRGGLVLLALLAVGCMGGKTSYAAVLGAGAGLAAFASLWLPQFRARAWQALGVVAVALAGAFAAVILGSTGNLRLEPGALAEVHGVLPDRSWTGLALGTGAFVLVVATKWAGVAALLADRRTTARPEVWFAVGAGAAGLLLAAALGHPGSSQLYFPVSAGLAVGVVSAWGLAEALHRVPRGWLVAAVLLGALAAAAGRTGVLGAPAWAGPYLLWSAPVALAATVLVVGVPTHGRSRPDGGLPARALGASAVCAVTAALVTGLVVTADTARSPVPAPPAAGAPLAWTDSHEQALRWVRENTAQDDVVVTNRQCSGARPGLGPCGDYRWFLTAALGQRRTYVEGADYVASQPPPEWVLDRVQLSRRFVGAPTPADARTLWDAGVRWAVVDLASTPNREWAPYAEEVFATRTTVVLRLTPP